MAGGLSFLVSKNERGREANKDYIVKFDSYESSKTKTGVSK
jgi:hypothetical protein